MNAWPIGLSTGCFYREPIGAVLELIRDSGFREIEICSFPKHLDYHSQADLMRARAQIETLHLRPVSFHAPFAERIDITSFDDDLRGASVWELITACRAAAKLGCERVVLHPGPERTGRPPEAEFLRHMRLAAESLNRVAAVCEEEGIELLLENMLPHLLFGRVSDMLYLLGEINSSSVGACLDTGHSRLAGDLQHVIHKFSGHLRLVHISDNCGDRDDHLPPGAGSINWPQVIAHLGEVNFNGPLILEMASKELESIDDTLTRARHGREYLARLLPEGKAECFAS